MTLRIDKPNTRLRRGFTLVEVLMVLAIIGISTIVAMPSLVKSIRGNRLRVGARTIVMAGNYARTMAILRNQDMKLVIDKTANSVTVEQAHDRAPLPEDRSFQEQTPAISPAPESESPTSTNESPTSALPPVRIVRQLDAVHIDTIKVDRKLEKGDDSTATIVYQSNGRCNPYEVRVVDEFGSSMLITVDTVASAMVKKEGD